METPSGYSVPKTKHRQTWLTENRENKKRAVDDAFNRLTSLCDNICKAEFQDKLRNQSFSELTQLFDQYMSYLRHENRKLSQFWISYLDMVEILLGLLRVSREGDWKLHLSCIRKMVPWCFAYNNLNYARYFFARLFMYKTEERIRRFRSRSVYGFQTAVLSKFKV